MNTTSSFSAIPAIFPSCIKSPITYHIKSPDAPVSNSPGNYNSTRPKKVILADDDIDDRELFVEAVNESGLKIIVELAEDGNKLIELLATINPLPDLIFLDLNMPNKNGKECLSDIRKIDAYREIPIIIYSTSSSLRDIDDTFQKGANLYVKKPSSFSDLLEVTRQVLLLDWSQYSSAVSRKDFVFPSGNR